MKYIPRRDFLRYGGSGLAGTCSMSSFLSILDSEFTFDNKNIPENLTIVLQGDSITDGGRNKSHYYANDASGMGYGYVYQIASQLLGQYPEKNWRFYNRGVSGNKVYQLADRWDDDCLQLQPDVLSLLIGVNDFWHTLHDYKGTVRIFETDLRALLRKTFSALPGLRLILGEPFALKGGDVINDKWYPDFPAYQNVVKRIAKDFNAHYIPYQKIFDDALERAPVHYWSRDGVHPTMAGAYLMKEAWIDSFLKLF